MTTKKDKTIKALPEYLQPRILSAVAYVHECSPNINKAVERINNLQRQLSEKEIMWVMSLLTFEKLLDIVKDSQEFEKYETTIKERTIQ
jgi:hypothetical protein|tara:strand:- start:200 stop:466 length:267 start_codon:yes stop_codon:yes gene_type:complete